MFCIIMLMIGNIIIMQNNKIISLAWFPAIRVSPTRFKTRFLNSSFLHHFRRYDSRFKFTKYHLECVDRRKNNEGFDHVHGKVSDTSFFLFFFKQFDENRVINLNNIIPNLLIPEHIQNCETLENPDFLRKGKMVISVKIRNFYRS